MDNGNIEQVLTQIQEQYGVTPSVAVTDARTPNDAEHEHVFIAHNGGLLWLDISEQSDHHCVDVRQFNEDGRLKGQGYFTIVNGRRAAQDQPLLDTAPPRQNSDEPTGKPVRGHGWDGGYVITLLTDKHGREESARKPEYGVG